MLFNQLNYPTTDVLTLLDRPNGVLLTIPSRRPTSFNRQAKCFELTDVLYKTKWSKKAGKAVLTASQFLWFQALAIDPRRPLK